MKRRFRVWGRRRVERELEEEIEAHLRMRAEALEARGLSPAEARREAERRFGDAGGLRTSVRRGARRSRVRTAAGDVGRDLALVRRRVARKPGAAAVELAIFALGVGLTTATFTLVDRVLLRPLPLPEPERLVSLESVDERGNAFPFVSISNWWDWQSGASTLAASGLHRPDRRSVAAPGGLPTRVAGQTVLGGFFEAVRMPVLVGRLPTGAEIQAGDGGLVVGEGLWRRLLGADRSLRTPLRLLGEDRDVVGVVPEGRGYPEATELWVPQVAVARGGRTRNNVSWHAVARLAPGATAARAREELSSIADGIREADPDGVYSWGVGVEPLQDFVVGDVRDELWTLMGAVLAVLLLAAVNLAALHLARGTAAAREHALRRALGASRWRLVRQELTRHLVVAAAGGAVGVILAWLGAGLAGRQAGAALPRGTEVGVDLRVALVGIGVALLAGALAGLAPALKATTASLGSLRSEGGAASSGSGRVLVGVEVALAVLLVAGAGVLVRDFLAVVGRDPGFEPDRLVVAEVELSEPRYAFDWDRPGEGGARARWWDEAVRVAGALPGVAAAGVSTVAPPDDHANGFVLLDGEEGPPRRGAGYQAVAGGYFEAMGMTLLDGRLFDERDGPGTERVTVVSRALAEEFWPDVPAPGRRIQATSMESLGREAPWLTVVGVVEDVRHYGFAADPAPEMWVLAHQIPFHMGAASVVARARSDPGAVAEQLREALQGVDRSLAVETTLMGDRLAGVLDRQRLLAGVLTAFGILATLLASLGVYGLIAFAVSRRTREMGVRSALGARRADLLGMVLGSALGVAGAGIAVGLAGAWLLRGALEPQLAALPAGDPAAFLGAAALLLFVSALAALRPAWAAARLDPTRALRAD